MAKSPYTPKGYNTVTTHMIVENALDVLTFMKKSFGAEVVEKHMNPDKSLMHAQIMIDDTRLMLCAPCAESSPMPVSFYMYVADCDKAHKKALKLGAVSTTTPDDQFWGDRAGAVRDMGGNIWWLATRLAKVSAPKAKKAPSKPVKAVKAAKSKKIVKGKKKSK